MQNVKIWYNERESGKDVNVSSCREVGGGETSIRKGTGCSSSRFGVLISDFGLIRVLWAKRNDI